MNGFDFKSLITERNKRFFLFIAIETTILLIMCCGVCWCIYHERQDLMVYSVWIYAVLGTMTLPILIGCAPYIAPAVITSVSDQIIKLIAERLIQIQMLAETPNIDVSSLVKTLEQQMKDDEDIIRGSFFEAEQKARPMIEDLLKVLNSDKIGKYISQKQKQLDKLLGKYLQTVIRYIEQEQKSVQDNPIHVQNLSQVLFSDTDIQVFRKMAQIYR